MLNMVKNNNSITFILYESLKNFFYWNSTFIFNIFGIFKDIKNYLYLIKSIKKISKTKIWKDLNFKIDWYGMPYTAINYSKDFFDLDSETQKKFVVRDIAKLFKEFEQYNFWEILTLKVEKLEGENIYAMRVWFRPIYYFISFKNFISTLLLCGIIYYFYNNFNTLKTFYN